MFLVVLSFSQRIGPPCDHCRAVQTCSLGDPHVKDNLFSSGILALLSITQSILFDQRYNLDLLPITLIVREEIRDPLISVTGVE